MPSPLIKPEPAAAPLNTAQNSRCYYRRRKCAKAVAEWLYRSVWFILFGHERHSQATAEGHCFRPAGSCCDVICFRLSVLFAYILYLERLGRCQVHIGNKDQVYMAQKSLLLVDTDAHGARRGYGRTLARVLLVASSFQCAGT